MFKFLKKKIKGAIDNIGKAAEEEVVEEAPEEIVEEKPKKVEKKEVKKEKPKKETKKESPKPAQEQPAPKVEEPKEEIIEKQEEVVEEKPKKRFFTKVSEKITTVQLSEEQFDNLFWDLELALLENNVAVEVIEKIKADLQDELTTGRQARGKLSERISRRLEESLREVLRAEPIDLLVNTQEHKPLIIALVGINGSGKTTTLGKLAKYFQDNNKSVVFAAGDTFRAAAIQQLEEHANNLDIPLIQQPYGADPAAVAFDAVKHAEANNIDVVLIDTAGRLHSNTNLMDELAKVIRVAKPHHVLFVGESITGNDCVMQASKFSEVLPIDGVILTKADVDEKGGAALSVSYVTRKPILFLTTGQEYTDLEPFSEDTVIENLLPN